MGSPASQKLRGTNQEKHSQTHELLVEGFGFWYKGC